MDAASELASASRGLAFRAGGRRVHCGAVSRVGIRHGNRDVPRALPHTSLPASGDGGADPLHRRARGADPAGGPHVEPKGRAAPELQRLFDRWRRDRRARLRQLRHTGRLRGARATWHRRDRQGRHRPLRRFLARNQTEGRRPRTARSGASSIPTPGTMATPRATSTRTGPIGGRTVRSGARSPTCRSFPATR